MHNAGNRKVNMKLKIYEAGEQLNRIANTLEEILRLVKLDLEKTAKRFPEPETGTASRSLDSQTPTRERVADTGP